MAAPRSWPVSLALAMTLSMGAAAEAPQPAYIHAHSATARLDYLANATIWRSHTSEELARTLAQTDPHSPRRLRVVGPFSNLDAFAAAFGLDDDAPVMRPPAQRLEIW